ncbi:MAG: hypothetical protein P9L97_10550 [Candidatus Tenebribacter davisii]|jgi:hypothetical protein|nr:hypothetical protein [Candidatus Tenebribacter davisii]
MAKISRRKLNKKINSILTKRISDLEKYVRIQYKKNCNSHSAMNLYKNEYKELHNYIEIGIKGFIQFTNKSGWKINKKITRKYEIILSHIGKVFLLQQSYNEFYKYLLFSKGIFFILELSFLELGLKNDSDTLSKLKSLDLDIKFDKWISLDFKVIDESDHTMKTNKSDNNYWIQIITSLKIKNSHNTDNFLNRRFMPTTEELINNRVNEEIYNLISLGSYNDYVEKLIASEVLKDLANRIGAIYQETYKSDSIKLQVSESDNSFIKQDDYWNVVYEGVSGIFKNYTGMSYIDYLVHHPFTKIHCKELVNTMSVESSNKHIQVKEEGLVIEENIKQSIMDERFKNEVKTELKLLYSDLYEAKDNNDIGRIESIEEEIDIIERKCSNTRFNQIKDTGSEKVRISVYKNYKKALDSIKLNGHIKLYQHFMSYIETGYYFSYKPLEDISWD